MTESELAAASPATVDISTTKICDIVPIVSQAHGLQGTQEHCLLDAHAGNTADCPGNSET